MQIKPIHLLLFLMVGFVIGCLWMAYGGDKDISDDSNSLKIKRLEAEVKWRDWQEKKHIDTIKTLKEDFKNLAKEKFAADQKATKAERRYASVRWIAPITRKDTVEFLKRDTTLCDSVILAQKEVTRVIANELSNSQEEVKQLDSLNSGLQLDKKNLMVVDSLHKDTEKQLVKRGKKHFLRGLGIGGVLGIILALVL